MECTKRIFAKVLSLVAKLAESEQLVCPNAFFCLNWLCKRLHLGVDGS